MKKIAIALIIPVLLGVEFTPSFLTSVNAQSQSPNVFGDQSIDWNNGIIYAIGEAAIKTTGNATQNKILATRAAMLDAQRQLLETVQGVNLDSQTTVKNQMDVDDVIQSKTNGILRGARQIGERSIQDGGVRVKFAVNLFGPTSLASAVLPTVLEKKNVKPRSIQRIEPAPPTPAIIQKNIEEAKKNPEVQTPTKSSEPFTGIIIDGRGLGVMPAMSPAIVSSDGEEIYVSNRSVDPDFVVNQGIVRYVKNLEDGFKNSRVGSNPLYLKAEAKSGLQSCDLVLNQKMAAQLKQSDQETKFLDDSNVVFIID